MEKSDYDEKMRELLEDRSTYTIMRADPALKLQKSSNTYVKIMGEKNYIDHSLRQYLTRYDSISPKIYGLPKIHKPNAPLRPIVSCVKFPTYYLSTFLANILSCIGNDEINGTLFSDTVR